MGKRSSNITGLSRRVLDALKESAADAKPTPAKSTTTEHSTVKANINHSQYNREERPPKRRRTEPLVHKRAKYDATGLVPRYRNALQVPDHLQKCMGPWCFFSIMIDLNGARLQISLKGSVISRYMMKDVCWTRRDGTVSRLSA
jgi:hypothetical protein